MDESSKDNYFKNKESSPLEQHQQSPSSLQSKEPEQNDAFKDLFYSTDLAQYFKKGFLPIVFIVHCLAAILTTYLIISEQRHLMKLQQETRLLQQSFYFDVDEVANPSRDFRRNFYFTTMNTFLSHLDKVIMKLYNINDSIPFTIHLPNTFRLELNHRDGVDYKDYHLPINNPNDNPLRQMTSEELRKLLAKIKQMYITVKYQTKRLSCDVCQIIQLTLMYDLSRISFVEFTTMLSYDNCNYDIFTKKTIINGFVQSNSIICIILILLAMIETYSIIMKIAKLISVILIIKQNVLSANRFSNFIGANSLLYSGKTPWDLIAKKDIFSLFPKWLLLFLLGDIFIFLSCFIYIVTPFFTTYNQILFGFSAIISWVSIGYYFQGHKSYFCFYQTLHKSLRSYRNLLVTFTLLFTGFVLLHLTLYMNNEKWYNGFHGSFITLFAAFQGDLLLNIWYSTIESSPILTIFLSVVLYILFIGCHLRLMFTMTQEAFELSNLEKKKSWLDHNFTLHDYVAEHFDMSDNDDSDEDDNFGLSDMWLRAIINTDDMNNLLDVDLDKLQGKGYNIESIKKYLNKYRKEELRKQRSAKIFNQIIDSNLNPSKITKSEYFIPESVALGSKNKEIDNLFNNLHMLFKELSAEILPVKSKKNGFITNNRIMTSCMTTVNRLEKIKDDLED